MKTTQKEINLEIKLENLRNEWNRLCLWGGGKNLDSKILKVEERIEKIELMVERNKKLRELGF